MSNYVGIDLGTTFSAAAYVDASGMPRMIPNDRGENITPSCVALINDEISVGERARRQWGNAEESAAARFKRDMGTTKTHSIDGEKYSPSDLSAAVLQKIREDVEKSIGDIAEAVVTIPANFSQEARDATMAAATKAGLKVRHIVNEPTAAALYYAYQSGDELAGNYAVFDLGGGTFDVSIIRINGQEVDVLASNGLSKLGGDDFDQALWTLIASKYKAETGFVLTREDFSLNQAEEEKKSLSQRKRTTAEIERELIDITRIEFEECVSGLIAQISMMCESTLDEADLDASEITAVLLAGGSTRIPAVVDCATKAFGQEPMATANVDEVVALGACLYAAYRSDGSTLTEIQKKSVSRLKITEVTNEYFGTITLGHSESRGEELINSILISKGEKLPCSVTKSYFTVFEGQDSISCRITESKSPESNPKFVKIIHEEEFTLPPGRAAGMEIQITYSYDENQMMNASFKDVSSGQETKITLSRASDSAASSKINKFLVD